MPGHSGKPRCSGIIIISQIEWNQINAEAKNTATQEDGDSTKLFAMRVEIKAEDDIKLISKTFFFWNGY